MEENLILELKEKGLMKSEECGLELRTTPSLTVPGSTEPCTQTTENKNIESATSPNPVRWLVRIRSPYS
jgi:hypothetical protein